MIDSRAIQQVKDVVRIEEVVGDFVNLKRKGPRFLGLCPFHNEKTPSFNVSPALGIYKCFGCGEAGDSITFLEKHEHLNYVEAIRWLAKRYNIELPEEDRTPEQEIEHSERESLAVIQAWAQKWSSEQLWESEEGKRIGLSYFHERGFRDETIRTFGLGYVPEYNSVFATAAIANGFNPELLEKAGWIKRREDGTPWDFFAGRVTFPVHSLSGQVIAFGARTLKSDKKLPKYFNSPESVLYNKSRSLYGIWFAKKAIVEAGTCYLVEGYTDVTSLHQAGIQNVVASSGTSLTEDQVRLIKRYTTSVTILYDGDPAGIKASLRGIDLILAEGLSVKVVLFPDGEDPDSFARTKSSKEVSEFLLRSAEDFIVFKTAYLVKEAGGDPIKRAELVRDIVVTLSRIKDHLIKAAYTRKCSELLNVHEQALISEINKELNRKRQTENQKQERTEEIQKAISARQNASIELEQIGTKVLELELLRLLLRYGHVEIGHAVSDLKEPASTQSLTVGEWIYSELEEDEMLIENQLVQAAVLNHRSVFAFGYRERLYHFLEQPAEELRQLVINLTSDKDELHNWASKKIFVPLEKDHLFGTVRTTLRLYKEKYVDKLIEAKHQEVAKCGNEGYEKPMQDKIVLERLRLFLSKESGRVIVGINESARPQAIIGQSDSLERASA